MASSAWRAVAGIDQERLLVMDLRGRGGSVDIRAPKVRALLVASILTNLAERGLRPGALVVDVAGAWMAPLGIEENSNTDARTFLEAVDALRLELGAGLVLLTHHAGHSTQERSRGASAFRDWPSSIWTLTREEDKKSDVLMGSRRYLSAFGRSGVQLDESALELTGAWVKVASEVGYSRKDASKDKQARDVDERVLDALRRHGPISQTALLKEMKQEAAEGDWPSIGKETLTASLRRLP